MQRKLNVIDHQCFDKEDYFLRTQNRNIRK